MEKIDELEKKKIKRFIGLINSSFEYTNFYKNGYLRSSEYYFTNGGCLQFCELFKKLYSNDCKIVSKKDINSNDFDHVVILYKDSLFDTTGELNNIEDYDLEKDGIGSIRRGIDNMPSLEEIELIYNKLLLEEIHYLENIKKEHEYEKVI